MKNGEGLRILIMWMTSGGGEVRAPHSNNILDFITTPRQDPSHSWYRQYSTWPVRNVLPGLLCTKSEVGHCPPTSTFRPHHMISVPRSPYFSPLFCFGAYSILNANQRNQKQGRPGKCPIIVKRKVYQIGAPYPYTFTIWYLLVLPLTRLHYQYRGTIWNGTL